MKYRKLGKTGLRVSEIGLGGEWLERHNAEEVWAVMDRADEAGINILDCWMSNPEVRTNIGAAIEAHRGRWIIQGHLGSTWQNGQYVRTRALPQVQTAFVDLMQRMRTDYIDLGMIHFVDSIDELDRCLNGEFYTYVSRLKRDGVIRAIGMSSHNPAAAEQAAKSGLIDMLLFSVNPAFDMLPASEDLDLAFGEEIYKNAALGASRLIANIYIACVSGKTSGSR